MTGRFTYNVFDDVYVEGQVIIVGLPPEVADMIAVMQSCGATGKEVRAFARMNAGQRKKYIAQLIARSKSSHPHDAKWRRFENFQTALRVLTALKR